MWGRFRPPVFKLKRGVVVASSVLGSSVLSALLAGPLSHVTDPDQLALVERNTELLATATARTLTMSIDEQTDIADDVAAAMAVLASMASAATEDAENVVRGVVAAGIQTGLQVGFKILATALVAA